MSLTVGASLPSLDGATEWLNADGAPAPDHGPTLVHFWAVSCPACKVNMPALQALRDKYAPHGLRVVAVHLPMYDGDSDVARVRTLAAELGMTEPCAHDGEHALGDRFETGGMWPVYFLFDAENKLRRRAAGGFGVRFVETGLERLFPTLP